MGTRCFGVGVRSVVSSVLGSSSDAHGGTQAAIATRRTDTWNGIATDLTARVVPTATYRAEAFMKVAGAASDRVARARVGARRAER